MSDTLLRHWLTLRNIPRHPRKIAAASLAAILEDSGYAISRRSLERDLQKLSAIFPIRCDDKHKPYGWSWSADGAPFDLPAMDVHTALAFRLASDHLTTLLPETTRSYLEPHFHRARTVLDNLDGNALSAWPQKVRVLPSGQALLPPEIDRDVLERVQQALLTERRMQVAYRKRGETVARVHEVHAQGLVWRDAVGVLVCTLWNYDDVVQLMLHRMESVQVDELPRRALAGFSVDAYTESGAFGYLLGETHIQLELAFDAFAAVRVRETPLAAGQELRDLPNGRVLLCAHVADTGELRAWIRSFGQFVEVLAPPELRADLAFSAFEMVQRYASLSAVF
jgi:predicted DNA-binding transcriptional regulator YafY